MQEGFSRTSREQLRQQREQLRQQREQLRQQREQLQLTTALFIWVTKRSLLSQPKEAGNAHSERNIASCFELSCHVSVHWIQFALSNRDPIFVNER